MDRLAAPPGHYMRKIVSALFAYFCVLVPALLAAQTSQNFQTISVDHIHAGMRGVSYTVFQGIKPESMDVEVLGVLRNVNGPKGDIILVRLHGEKVEYTGVVAGMSGSPVYLDGKLAGALAFRIGTFSKEPIAGVTPIAEMFEINAMDRSQGSSTVNAGASVQTPTRTSGPGAESFASKDYANYLKP